MTMQVQVLGAAGEVTGSCHLVRCGDRRLLIDCGLIQGSARDELRNREEFPFDPTRIDAVVLSHAHLDHSGRLPLLAKRGYGGPIFTHAATADLCRVMLRDAAYLNERDAAWDNRKRQRKGLAAVQPLYTMADAEALQDRFVGLGYGQREEILPGISLRLTDAGHILGSAIVELWLSADGRSRKLVFSGDLGRSGMPVLRDPAPVEAADLLLLESTYGDRLHRTWADTMEEIKAVFGDALERTRGNVLVPAFAVGRTQDLLYLFAKYRDAWQLDRWRIFLDSPLAIEATEVYLAHSALFDAETRELWRGRGARSLLPNLTFTPSAEESMQLNRIESGAVIVAGSGMCDGGRIKHHLKHNVWRKSCRILITGYQARGTTGRALVDGARHIRLWGEAIRVAASVHTLGGLSAHADQAGLLGWYQRFDGAPPVLLVHGEERGLQGLAGALREGRAPAVEIAAPGLVWDLAAGRSAPSGRQPGQRTRRR